MSFTALKYELFYDICEDDCSNEDDDEDLLYFLKTL